MEIKSMTLEELKDLQTKIEEEITQRELSETKEYEFEFKYQNDPRKGKPYAARLTLDENGKVTRDFFDLNREYGKNSMLVYGTYTAKDGDIVEERQGGSWKNDYRYWFLVRNGELIQVADIDRADQKARVIEYMSGKITAEELAPEK